jgi:hypothetical protein
MSGTCGEKYGQVPVKLHTPALVEMITSIRAIIVRRASLVCCGASHRDSEIRLQVGSCLDYVKAS